MDSTQILHANSPTDTNASGATRAKTFRLIRFHDGHQNVTGLEASVGRLYRQVLYTSDTSVLFKQLPIGDTVEDLGPVTRKNLKTFRSHKKISKTAKVALANVAAALVAASVLHKKLTFHPLADLFPLMEGQEFEALVDDIKAHGCREPIHTLNGKILDGRNRWRACQQLDITPKVIEYTGNDPAAFVISLNIHRRHLNESQRAMVAAMLARLQDGQRKSGSPIGEAAVTQGEAAKALNVGKRQVERARKVRAKGSPELVQAVEQGKVSVSAAAEIADQPKAEQKKIVKKGKRSVQAAAKKAKAKKKTTKKAKATPKQSDRIEPRYKEYRALPQDQLIRELVTLMHDARISVEQIRVAFESVST